jgi:hypothetical protein
MLAVILKKKWNIHYYNAGHLKFHQILLTTKCRCTTQNVGLLFTSCSRNLETLVI